MGRLTLHNGRPNTHESGPGLGIPLRWATPSHIHIQHAADVDMLACGKLEESPTSNGSAITAPGYSTT